MLQNIENSKYLTDEAMQTNFSAVMALKKETQHLYSLSIKIVLNSLALSSRKILSSDKNAESLVNESILKSDLNIGELYLQKIKNIYSDIFRFASSLDINMSSESIEKI